MNQLQLRHGLGKSTSPPFPQRSFGGSRATYLRSSYAHFLPSRRYGEVKIEFQSFHAPRRGQSVS